MQAHHFVCAVFLMITVTLSGEERAVNVRTSGTQSNAAIAAGPRGLIVVWNSYHSSNGRSYDILARRLDPNGEPEGDEFQVNPADEGRQCAPSVATDSEGRYVVAWQGPGGDQEDVYVRLYDADGQPRSDVFVAPDDPNDRQLRPRVAVDSNGDFVVVWENRIADGNDEIYSVTGRWFSASGRPRGVSLRLDEGTGDARYPDVALDARGNAAVTWLRDRDGKAVFARRFDPNGAPQTASFEVSSWSFSSMTGPSVAMNKAGHFVVVWDGDPNRAGDDKVLARCYDPNGTAKGEPFRLDTSHEGAQQWPQVAIDDANAFVVVWQQEMPDPNTATDIVGRRFDEAGYAVGEPMLLNAYTSGHQRYPDVTFIPDGGIAAVWESEGQDGSSYGIRACLFK